MSKNMQYVHNMQFFQYAKNVNKYAEKNAKKYDVYCVICQYAQYAI